ncbi:MAG: hypothetical protein OFPII_22480 [Osedax symbiont Rs1]|nr:MAG: hypothetical protein OFPII_22480 [Osedax symbiont Rs1]
MCNINREWFFSFNKNYFHYVVLTSVGVKSMVKERKLF